MSNEFDDAEFTSQNSINGRCHQRPSMEEAKLLSV